MENIKETLENKAQYLCVSIPYDKDDEPNLISFDDGCMTEYIAAKDLSTKAKDHNWTLHPIILVFKGWELAEYEVMG